MRWSALFQVHLFTVIVLVFCAGGLIGMNITPYQVSPVDRKLAESALDCEGIGWPLTFRFQAKEWNSILQVDYNVFPDRWSWSALFCDVAACGAIMAGAGFLAESCFNKKGKREQPGATGA